MAKREHVETDLDLFAVAAHRPPVEDLELLDCARLDGVPEAVIALVTGVGETSEYQRWQAVKALQADFGVTDIAYALGKSKSAVTVLLRYDRLPVELVAAWAAGALSDGQAKAIVKLGQLYQEELAKTFVVAGRLTGADIAHVKSVGRAAALADLPAELFEVIRPTEIRPPAPAPDALAQVKAAALALQRALDAQFNHLPAELWPEYNEFNRALAAACWQD